MTDASIKRVGLSEYEASCPECGGVAVAISPELAIDRIIHREGCSVMVGCCPLEDSTMKDLAANKYLAVRRESLEFLSSMVCEYAPKDEMDCMSSFGHYSPCGEGSICNSCAAREFAERLLKDG